MFGNGCSPNSQKVIKSCSMAKKRGFLRFEEFMQFWIYFLGTESVQETNDQSVNWFCCIFPNPQPSYWALAVGTWQRRNSWMANTQYEVLVTFPASDSSHLCQRKMLRQPNHPACRQNHTVGPDDPLAQARPPCSNSSHTIVNLSLPARSRLEICIVTIIADMGVSITSIVNVNGRKGRTMKTKTKTKTTTTKKVRNGYQSGRLELPRNRSACATNRSIWFSRSCSKAACLATDTLLVHEFGVFW